MSGIPQWIPLRAEKGTMKRLVSFILIYSLSAIAAPAQQQPAIPNQSVVHVATALNHLTVLEFHEPVTMVAAGSADFQIERQESKVFVKPMKVGVHTDLFVWTASRRFAYELETTDEVKNMNFAIDSLAPNPPPLPQASSPTDEIADMMLTRVFLGAEAIQSPAGHPAKNKVNVRVEEVFRTRTSVYVHYVLENKTKQPYHVPLPSAVALEPHNVDPVLPTLMRKQLDQRAVQNLGSAWQKFLPVAHAESHTKEVQPGETTQGIVVIRMGLASPVVVQLVFDAEVKAAVVL